MNFLTQLIFSPVVTLGTYYVTTLVQTVFHRWFGHHRRLDAVYENHVAGHHRDYPASRLMADDWIVAERHVMWYYALPLLPLSVLAAWALPWPLFTLHVAALAFTIWWHLYLHMHYHLNSTPWARFRWFREKRTLHLRHHVSHHRNYAIIEFFWDRLFGSYDARPVPVVRCTCKVRDANECACGRQCQRLELSGTRRRVSSPARAASPRND